AARGCAGASSVGGRGSRWRERPCEPALPGPAVAVGAPAAAARGRGGLAARAGGGPAARGSRALASPRLPRAGCRKAGLKAPLRRLPVVLAALGLAVAVLAQARPQ